MLFVRLGAAAAAAAIAALAHARRKASTSRQVYDVMVVGGGVLGVWSAVEAAKQNASVALLDQYDAGHGKGSSHGDGRIYRFAYAEDLYVDSPSGSTQTLLRLPSRASAKIIENGLRFGRRRRPQVDMMDLALERWRDLDEGGDILSKTGGVSLYSGAESDTSYASHGAYEGLRDLYARRGLAHETWTADELSEKFPQFAAADGNTTALFQPDFGVLFATPAVKKAWALARQLGVDARENAAATGVARKKDGTVEVRVAGGGVVRGKAVVVAPGAWLTNVAATWFGLDVRSPRGHSNESRRRRGCHVDIPWRRVAATPRLPRGYSMETSRGDAAAATWIFRGGASRRRRGATWTLGRNRPLRYPPKSPQRR